MLRVLVVLFLSLFAAAPTLAQFVDPARPGNESTVDQISSKRLGSAVTLLGNIVERHRDDYYTFRDDTGEIRVEIERRVFRNQGVTPDTLVRIRGEIERGWFGRYIDVGQLTVVH